MHSQVIQPSLKERKPQNFAPFDVQYLPCPFKLLKNILQGPPIFLNSKKELSQISRNIRRKIMKICENLKKGNRNHHERITAKEQIFLLDIIEKPHLEMLWVIFVFAQLSQLGSTQLPLHLASTERTADVCRVQLQFLYCGKFVAIFGQDVPIDNCPFTRPALWNRSDDLRAFLT